MFETVPVRFGVPFRLEAHLERLRGGASILGLPVPADLDDELALFLVTLAGEARAALRITLTSGDGAGIDPAPSAAPRLILQARRLPQHEEEGAVALVRGTIPVYSGTPLRSFKSLSYVEARLERREARARGAWDAIRHNEHGALVGTSVANLFLVRDGRLITPRSGTGALPGVTRATVIELAAEVVGSRVVEAEPGYRELLHTGELFVTNALTGIVPVASVDGVRVGTGVAGPVTLAVRKAYQDRVRRETESGQGVGAPGAK